MNKKSNFMTEHLGEIIILVIILLIIMAIIYLVSKKSDAGIDILPGFS